MSILLYVPGRLNTDSRTQPLEIAIITGISITNNKIRLMTWPCSKLLRCGTWAAQMIAEANDFLLHVNHSGSLVSGLYELKDAHQVWAL